MGDEFRKEV